MHLQISGRTRVKGLKAQFSELFPFLKIELFRQQHQKGQGTGLDQKVHDKLFLREVTGTLKEGRFEFESDHPVARFEAALQNEFGLPVQVFRKSGEIWLETVQTDSLSLEKQNEMGRETSLPGRTRFNVNTLFL